MSKNNKIDYENLVQESLRSVMKGALKQASKNGLPGSHHFYISYRTDFPGVDMPDYLCDEYPEEITIVLQYEFWDLEVEDDCFHVTLCFNDIHERLTIPFEAIVSFVDPSVKFGLQFTPNEYAPEPEVLPTETKKKSRKKTHKNEDEGEPDEENGSNVITLDAFRKK